MRTDIKYDVFRYSGKYRIIGRAQKDKGLKYIIAWRELKNKSLFSLYYKYILHIISSKNGIEIPLSVEIDEGMKMIHPFNITINSKAKIGRNFTILKGATVGNCKGGKLDGAPVIGDNVYIGLNSTVVGNITIGNDVLIAANAFVNFNVPDHSIVIGNPGVIHHKEDATGLYIDNRV